MEYKKYKVVIAQRDVYKRQACTQLLRLLNRNITAYAVKDGALSEGKLFSGEKGDTEDFLTPEEQQTARWVCENRQRAGASTHHFPNAKCLYLAIRSGNSVYGVVGIPMQKETLDSFEYSILLSVINECALAMENAQNAVEKEKIAVLAKNEQLRADLLRAISHDLRTPLCSISGNADMQMCIRDSIFFAQCLDISAHCLILLFLEDYIIKMTAHAEERFPRDLDIAFSYISSRETRWWSW